MKIPSVRFSTAGLSASQAYELATVVTSNVCGTRYKDDRCNMIIESWNLGTILINPVSSSAQYIWRTKRMATQSGIDHYRLRLCKETGVTLRIRGKEIKAAPGDITMTDLGQEFEIDGSSGEMIFIYIPRDVLYPMIPPGVREQLHGFHFKSGTVLNEMLVSHILKLQTLLPRMTKHDAPHVCDATLKLLVNAIACSSGETDKLAKRYPEVTATQIKTFIIENLTNTELDPGAIMKRFKLSRTSLYQMFQYCYGVSNYIRTLRLRRSLMYLVDPCRMNRSIGEIAFSMGFNNESHFSRIFRNFYGMTPSEARKAKANVIKSCASQNMSSSNLYNAVSTINFWQFDPGISPGNTATELGCNDMQK